MICPKCKTKLEENKGFLYHTEIGFYNWNCHKWTIEEYKKRGLIK